MPDQVSDAMLLERFVRSREESAFLALVERHGPRVEGICRRLLPNPHDVEDVSQATFFILARKAAVITWHDSVGGWLGSVARRLALGARSDRWRERQHVSAFTDLQGAAAGGRDEAIADRCSDGYCTGRDVLAEIERRELSRVLHEELGRLPEKYRDPVLLCDIEGRTHKDAARHLGWPSGTMSRRLERARVLLRRRLLHRGLALTIALVGFALVALGLWSASQRGSASAVAIRQMMVPLRPLSAKGGDLPGILAQIEASDSLPNYETVLELARRAMRVANDLETHDAGMNRDRWRGLTERMRESSALLAQAAEDGNRSAMVVAARRLTASCVNCHDLWSHRQRQTKIGITTGGT
jgi:RNA polymerase sigma-70 factor (ECF subfamily)